MQDLNQFSQSAERGQVSLKNAEGFTRSAIIDPAFTGKVATGDAVKLVAGKNGTTPLVTPVTSSTDKVFGFIVFNPVKNSFTGGDRVEVAITGADMYMIASGATNASDSVQYDATTGQVATQTGTNTVVGVAIDSATTANQLIRVYIKTL